MQSRPGSALQVVQSRSCICAKHRKQLILCEIAITGAYNVLKKGLLDHAAISSCEKLKDAGAALDTS